MKYSFRSVKPHALVAALALSLGLTANAFAEPPRGDGNHHHRHSGPGMFHKHGGGHHGGFGFGFSQRLHDDLKLDAKQEALWQDARKFARESFDGGRERFRKHQEEIAALLNQPGADLRAVAKRMDELRAEGQKQHDEMRERWMTVYDALSPGQKEKVRLFLKDQAERHERGFDKQKRRPGGRQGPGQPPSGQPLPAVPAPAPAPATGS